MQAAITIDTDWASDEILEYTAKKFIDAQIKSTWFITHSSPFISKILKQTEFFEIGLHPNFLPESTHGKSIPDVLKYLLQIHPQAQIMRTHSLYQSTHLFQNIVEQFPQIKLDVSLFLPYQKDIKVHKLYLSLTHPHRFIYRIPFIWEDDFEMLDPKSNFNFNLNNFSKNRINIFNLHPIHIALNSSEMKTYQNLKQSYNIRKISLEECFRLRKKDKKGCEDFINGIFSHKNKIYFNHLMNYVKEDNVK